MLSTCGPAVDESSSGFGAKKPAAAPQRRPERDAESIAAPPTAMKQAQHSLILSSNSAFSRELTESWQRGGDAPEFVLLEEICCSYLHATRTISRSRKR